MKITIVDERKGDVITPEIQASMDNSKVVLRIQSDGHVVAENGGTAVKKLTAHACFFDAPHRDVISGDKSADAWDKREREKHGKPPKDGYSAEAVERAKVALAPQD